MDSRLIAICLQSFMNFIITYPRINMLYYFCMNLNWIFDKSIPLAAKRELARAELRIRQRQLLPTMRNKSPSLSRLVHSLTLITYTFPFDETDFDFIEFAIRQTWRCLGRLKTVVVADRPTPVIERFRLMYPDDVIVQIEPTLKPGEIVPMSSDCIERLYKRFTTPYCLVVQDDGFPINSNIEDFIGKYDYIGAPTIRDVPAQYLVDIFRCACLNGGFSLRSKKICKDVAQQWKFWKRFITIGSTPHAEDVFYTKTACMNPLFRLRNRLPSSKIARRFSLPDFDGVVDIRKLCSKTLGAHGVTAILQLSNHWDNL